MAHSPQKESSEKVSELRKAFQFYDKDSNGTISVSELGAVMKSMGYEPSDAQLKKVIGAFDTNKNGAMEFSEFLVMMQMYTESRDIEEDAKLAFQIFDLDNNGLITHSELKSVLIGLGEQITDAEVDEMIRVADLDKDGKLNYTEFTNMMRMKEGKK